MGKFTTRLPLDIKTGDPKNNYIPIYDQTRGVWNTIASSSILTTATSASFATTASYVAGNVLSSSFATTASYVAGNVLSSSYSVSSSFSTTASYVAGNVLSSSYSVSSSFSTTASAATSITFVPPTASFATTASYVAGNVLSASYALTSSFSTTASAATSITFIPPTASYSNTASFAITASYVNGAVLSSSYATTASAATSITFVPPTASFATTASAATSITFVPPTASFATTASHVVGTVSSASYALTSSFSTTASAATSITFIPPTASFSTTASAATSITFIPPTASFATTASYVNGTVLSSSYALTSSFSTTASAATSITFVPPTASFAITASAATSITFTPPTASFAITASYVNGTVLSSSYALTSSFTTTASAATSITFIPPTASFAVTASHVIGTVISASYALTASFSVSSSRTTTASLAVSSSFAISSSHVIGNVLSSSYSVSSSFSTTASAATSITFVPPTASFAITASYVNGTVLSSSYALTSSYANVATTIFPFSGSAVITGSLTIHSGSINVISGSVTASLFGTASNATTASFATTASAATSITFTPSTASYALTSSIATSASYAITSSHSNRATTIFPFSGSAIITGSLTILSGSINIISGSVTGSLFGTASIAVSASFATTASYVTATSVVGNVTSASYALTSSFATTASYVSATSVVGNVTSASYALTSSFSTTSSLATSNISTASVSLNTITFTKGDGTQFNIQVSQDGTATSAISASYVEIQASTPGGPFYVPFVDTTTGYRKLQSDTDLTYNSSTNILNTTSSYALTASVAISASYALTSSFATTASAATSITFTVNTGSFTGSFIGTHSGSTFGTASVAVSSSFATTASYVAAGNIGGTVTSASYALTSSYANVATTIFPFSGSATITGSLTLISGSIKVISGSVTASLFGTASNATTASFSISSSFSTTASAATSITFTVNTGSFTGSFIGIHSGSTFGTSSWAVSASNATTASYVAAGSVGGTVISASYAATSSNLTGGTANYIPLWTSATAQSSSNIFQSTGNIVVGIDPSGPELLRVGGSIRASGNSHVVGAASSTTAINRPDNTGRFDIGGGSSTSVTAGARAIFQGVDVSAGSRGTLSLSAGLIASPTVAEGTIYLQTSGSNRIAIVPDGNVGIGTISPSGLLTIYSGSTGGLGGHIVLNNNGLAVANETALIFADGASTTYRAVIATITENAPYYGAIAFRTGIGAYSAITEKMRITGTGNVGIGNTNPDTNLSVIKSSGGLPVSTGTTPTTAITRIKASANNAMFMGMDTASPFGGWIQVSDITGLGTNYPILLNPNGGNVGVGITSPSTQLHLSSSQARITLDSSDDSSAYTSIMILKSNVFRGSGLRFESKTTAPRWFAGIPYAANHNNYQIGYDALNNIPEYAASASLTIIGSSGNVGIGTTSPARKLDVIGNALIGQNSNSSTAARLDITAGGGGFNSFIDFGFYETFDAGCWHIGRSGSSGAFYISDYATTGNELNAVTITTARNVGIGTSSPTEKLQVAGNTKIGTGVAANSQLLMVNTLSGTAAGLQLYQDANESWVIANPASSTALTFTNSNAERVRITGTGNVGIGTTSPGSTLHIQGNVSASSYTSSISNGVGYFGTASFAVSASYTTYAETSTVPPPLRPFFAQTLGGF